MISTAVHDSHNQHETTARKHSPKQPLHRGLV